MSFTDDRRRVRCDGDGCAAEAGLPVALRRALSGGGRAPETGGWLFAADRGGWRHFCPNCAARHLQALGVSASRGKTVSAHVSEENVMFQKILVPVDGTPKSLRAAEAVAELVAGRPNVCVTLALVIEALQSENSDYDEATVTALNAQARERAQCALASAARVIAERGIVHQTKVLTGEPVSAVIAQEAAEGGHDLVAMGSRGLGMQRADPHYLGSITEHVIRRVSIPVLVLPNRPAA